MNHTYEEAGTKYVNIDNIACMPEIDRLYKVETVGDGISTGMAGYVYDGKIVYVDESGNMFYDGVIDKSCDLSDLGETVLCAMENLDNIKIFVDQDARNIDSNATLVLPAGNTVAEYVKNLSDQVNCIKFPLQTEGMTIQAGAFDGFNHVKSIYFPPYIDKIEKGALSGCSSLNDIRIPTNLSGCVDDIIDDIGYDCIEFYDIGYPMQSYNGKIIQIGKVDPNSGIVQTAASPDKEMLFKSLWSDDEDPVVEKHPVGTCKVSVGTRKIYTDRHKTYTEICSFISMPAYDDFDFAQTGISVSFIDLDNYKDPEYHDSFNIESAIKRVQENYRIPFGVKTWILSTYPSIKNISSVMEYADGCKKYDKVTDNKFDSRDFTVSYDDMTIVNEKISINTHEVHKDYMVPHRCKIKVTVKGTFKPKDSLLINNISAAQTEETDRTIITVTSQFGLQVQTLQHQRTKYYDGRSETKYIGDPIITIYDSTKKPFWHNDPKDDSWLFANKHYFEGEIITQIKGEGDIEIDNKIINMIKNAEDYRLRKYNIYQLFDTSDELKQHHKQTCAWQ